MSLVDNGFLELGVGVEGLGEGKIVDIVEIVGVGGGARII